MGEEEAILKSIWEVLETSDIRGSRLLETLERSVKGLGRSGAVWGESWNGSWYRGCRSDMNTEASGGSQEEKCLETHYYSEGEGKYPSQSKWLGGSELSWILWGWGVF